MRAPPNRGNAKARPLAIVDGATRGPDGLPLSSFARFVAWITAEPNPDAEEAVPALPAGLVSIAAMADGSFVIASRDHRPLVVDADGATHELHFHEVAAPAFLEGMSQQMASTVFYGNTAINPEGEGS